jgi:hypothetical protein
MHSARHLTFCLCLFLSACADREADGQNAITAPEPVKASKSDRRATDFSILFVGNSHTMLHDLPGTVRKMISFRFPDRRVFTDTIGVGHLDEAWRDGHFKKVIESRQWKYVVLQAQKISQSGRYYYSRQEGIDMAKLAKARGASVIFYSEWGLRGVPGDGLRNEKIYRQMAQISGASVAAVNRAWDLALARRADLPLYHDDGNHQSPTGAFLTACVLFNSLTGESPAALASFPYPGMTEKDRKFLTQVAAEAIAAKAAD